MLHLPGDLKVPGVAIDGWIGKKVFRDNIVLVIGCHLRRKEPNRLDLSIVRLWRRSDLALEPFQQTRYRCRCRARTGGDEAPRQHTKHAQADEREATLQDSTSRWISLLHRNTLFVQTPERQPVLCQDEQKAKGQSHHR